MSVLKRQLDNGETVFFSVVDKQSDKGFFNNRRLLLLLENRFLCYLSAPNTNFPLSFEYVHRNAKTIVPLNNIHRLNYQTDNRLEVDFWVFENNKRISKTWFLRMETPALLGAWQELFDEYSNRSRKGTGTVEQNLAPQNLNLEANVSDSVTHLNNKPKSPPKPYPRPQESVLVATISQQVKNSNYLLKQDANESYFSLLHAMHPSKDHGAFLGVSNSVNSQLKISKFINYYRPHLQQTLQIESTVLRMTQLNQIDGKYQEFVKHATNAAIELVDHGLQEMMRQQDLRASQGKNSSRAYIVHERDDIVIEVGILELKLAGPNTYICDQTSNKRIQAHFKNLDHLHKAIAQVPLLRSCFLVPMSCLVTYKGIYCHISSKIEPNSHPEYLIKTHNHSSGYLFDLLSEVTQVSFSVFEERNRIQFVPINAEGNRFAVVHARCLIPELEPQLPIRSAAFREILSEGERRAQIGSRETEQQNLKIAQHILQKLQEISDLLNKLELYPLTPAQMGPILHSYGINLKYLGKIYPNLSQSYVQNVFKTEAAVRAFKAVFCKKMQDSLRQWGVSTLQEAALQLLNAFLGRGEDCAQLWKVVSLHSQKYFGVSVRQEEMSKGYLLLGLSQHLSVDIHPSSSNIDRIFRCDSFVEGVRFHPKVKVPSLLPPFLSDLEQQYDVSVHSHLYNRIIHLFQLQQQPFPSIITSSPYLHEQLLLLLSLYTSPKENRLNHLRIYDYRQQSPRTLTGASLQRRLAELRWEIKQRSPREYILVLADKLRQTVQDYYGQWHPFISDVWQLQGLYFLSLGEEEPAVSANKKALSNMVVCCGNNQGHLKLSNTHYHIAQCLTHYRRFPEALSHLRKAKHILDINQYQQQPAYAHLLTKIAVILLHQLKDTQSFQFLLAAANIYEHQDICSNWDQLVEIYELLSRCQLKPQTQQLQGLRLAEHCATKLEHVLNADGELCSDRQLARILKIVFEEYLAKIRKEEKNAFRDYIFEICDFMSQSLETNEEREALLYFRGKVAEGAFLGELQSWVSGAGEMVSRWRQQGGTRGLHNRSEAVSAFQYFMRRMVGLLGQCFLANVMQ